jgi:hypothetical protein
MGPRLKRETVLNNTPTVTNTPRAGETAEQSLARLAPRNVAPAHRWKIDKSVSEVMSTHIAVFAMEEREFGPEWVEKSHHKTVAEARAWIELQRLPEYHS